MWPGLYTRHLISILSYPRSKVLRPCTHARSYREVPHWLAIVLLSVESGCSVESVCSVTQLVIEVQLQWCRQYHQNPGHLRPNRASAFMFPRKHEPWCHAQRAYFRIKLVTISESNACWRWLSVHTNKCTRNTRCMTRELNALARERGSSPQPAGVAEVLLSYFLSSM